MTTQICCSCAPRLTWFIRSMKPTTASVCDQLVVALTETHCWIRLKFCGCLQQERSTCHVMPLWTMRVVRLHFSVKDDLKYVVSRVQQHSVLAHDADNINM